MLSGLFSNDCSSKYRAGLAAFFLCFGLASLASAADRPGKAEAAQYEKMIAQFQESPGAAAASDDIATTREWLSNAKVLLANGDEDGAAVLLRRVGFSLELIEALTTVGSIQKAADEQEAAYYKATQEQIPQLKQEIEELESKIAALKSQL